MKVIYDISKIKGKFVKPVLAIGVFDGLHIGHRRLIAKVIRRARRIRGTSVILTFSPHPAQVLNPAARLPLLASLEERIQLIEEMGVDVCIIAHFTQRFSRVSPENFIAQYLVRKIAPVDVLIGHDFRFGKDRRGDFKLLQALAGGYHFRAYSMPAVSTNGLIVSSTRIRKLILSGDLKAAARLLGRNVSVSGKVKRGDGRGKSLGFPTANIDICPQVILPRGVYIGRVIWNKKIFRAMVNVGVRPSFSPTNEISVEAHIFGLKQSIYGQTITVEFLKKIREERKFKTASSFTAQLQSDKKQTLRYFSR